MIYFRNLVYRENPTHVASIKFVSVVFFYLGLMNGVERFGETQRVTHVLSINLWIGSLYGHSLAKTGQIS